MDWNSSALWGLIGLVGGLVISSFFYFIGIKRKSLIYDITTTTLVSKNATQIENLNITYDNKPIRNLYTSTIKIKNDSNSIIEPDDFAPSVPLSLITNGEFLASSDTGVKLFSENNNDYNNVYPLFEVDDNNICKKLIIHFDYISKKETISCTVFHTGSLNVNGKLKEGKIRNSESESNLTHFRLSIISGIICIIITIVINIILNSHFVPTFTPIP